MFDKIITICINPALDTTIWVDNIDLNEPVLARDEKIYAGGKAVNVSRVLTALGIQNQLITFAGQDNSKKLSDLLKKEHVPYTFIPVAGGIRENFSIVTNDNELLKINRQGSMVTAINIEYLTKTIIETIETCQNPLLVFAGSLPKGVTPEQYKNLCLTFKDMGIKVCIDTDIFSFEDIIEISPYLIKPNQVELGHIAGFPIDSIDTAKQFAKKLVNSVEHILVSLGAIGLVYVSKNETHSYIPPKVEVKSTIGAGDTTLAAFIASLCKGYPYDKCVTIAGQCGTVSVTLPGTELVDKSSFLL